LGSEKTCDAQNFVLFWWKKGTIVSNEKRLFILDKLKEQFEFAVKLGDGPMNFHGVFLNTSIREQKFFQMIMAVG